MRPSHLVQCRECPLIVDDELCIATLVAALQVHPVDLLAMAAVVDVCVVMRSEGKGTGQIDRVPQQQTSD